MERLTFYENGKAHFLIGYSDYSGKVADRLAAYEDAEEQGLLIQLPCEIGTICYFISASGEIGSKCFYYTDIPHFGKTVFLTREEAIAAFAKEG